MNKDKWMKEFDKLFTRIENIRANQDWYEKTYQLWEVNMDNDIDGLITEFVYDFSKEAMDIDGGEPENE